MPNTDLISNNNKLQNLFNEDFLDQLFKRAFIILREESQANDLCQETIARKIERLNEAEEWSIKEARKQVKSSVVLSAIHLKENPHLEVEDLLNDFERFLPYEEKAFEADKIIDDKLLIEALSSLSEKQKEVVSFKYLNGLKFKEISEELGISIKTAEARLYSALKALRRYLKKKGVEDSSSFLREKLF